MTWTLLITIWLVEPGGAERQFTEALHGYVWQQQCVEDIPRAVAGRTIRDDVVTVAAKCVRGR